MTEWVSIVPNESAGEDEAIEISTEPNGNILLTSVRAQFPGTTGLKFRNPESSSGKMRGVRLQENELFPPDPQKKWGELLYICVCHSVQSATTAAAKAVATATSASGVKRKAEEDENKEEEDKETKKSKEDDKESCSAPTTDLIVLGIPFKTGEKAIKKYFEDFGQLSLCQLKKQQSGRSKGFAFIRFKDLTVQKKVLLTRHMIDGRWCDVKKSQNKQKEEDCKIFVAKLNDNVSKDDLKDHFDKFGNVTDVFLPSNRGFAFVTFDDSKVAQSLINKDHEINGVNVKITNAEPRSSGLKNQNQANQQRSRPFRGSRQEPQHQQHQQPHQMRVWDMPDNYDIYNNTPMMRNYDNYVGGRNFNGGNGVGYDNYNNRQNRDYYQ